MEFADRLSYTNRQDRFGDGIRVKDFTFRVVYRKRFTACLSTVGGLSKSKFDDSRTAYYVLLTMPNCLCAPLLEHKFYLIFRLSAQ